MTHPLSLFKHLSLGLLLSLSARPAFAADSKSASTRSYIYIKQDSDPYVGEGVTAIKDFRRGLRQGPGRRQGAGPRATWPPTCACR